MARIDRQLRKILMKIGLMLGGGGVFGAYQLGVIKALAEENY